MKTLGYLDLTIAVGGTGLGLLVGSLDNIRKTGSLFKTTKDDPENPCFIVRWLTVNRERNMLRGDPRIPRIWNPFAPLEHLLPLTLIGITQIFISTLSGGTAKNTARCGAKYACTVLVLPIIYTLTVFVGGGLLRKYNELHLRKRGIDPSGHALGQSAAAVYKFFTLYALSQLKISPYLLNLYRLTASVTTLSDYLWTYRTTSSYHSVMDMAVIIVFMGISFGAVCTGHYALTTSASKVGCQKCLVGLYKR